MKSRRTRPLNERQRKLAEDYLPLAKRYAARYARRYPAHAEELFGAANIALVRAAGTYRPRRGVRFSSWAIPQIVGAMIDHLRQERPLGYRSSSEHPATFSHSSSIRRADVDLHGLTTDFIADPPAREEERIEDEDVLRYLRHLDPLPALVVRMSLCQRRTQEEIAQVLQCSPSLISTIWQRACLDIAKTHVPSA